MFISNKLVYIQLEKTACTHIASLLSKYIGGTQFKKHNTIDKYNQNKLLNSNQLIVGSIRNPWDWYVSLWAFATKGDERIYKNVTKRSLRNALKTYSGVDEPGNFICWFKQKPFQRSLNTIFNSYRGLRSECNKPVNIWQECYRNPEEVANFRRWLKLIYNPNRAYDLGIGYGQNPLSKVAGLMTYRYCRLYTQNFFEESKKQQLTTITELTNFEREFNILDETIQVENLESDLISVLQKANYQLSPEQYNSIIQSPKTNKSKHLDTSDYYDAETIDLIAEKEKLIIDKYSYSPPLI